RDLIVTGVQTCALPIYPAHPRERDRSTVGGEPRDREPTTLRLDELSVGGVVGSRRDREHGDAKAGIELERTLLPDRAEDPQVVRSEEHTSELQSRSDLV